MSPRMEKNCRSVCLPVSVLGLPSQCSLSYVMMKVQTHSVMPHVELDIGYSHIGEEIILMEDSVLMPKGNALRVCMPTFLPFPV